MGNDWVAFVDESGSNASLDPDTYILAAAIVERDHIEASSDAMRALRKPGERKIHWRDDDGPRHDAVIAAIDQLPVEHVVVVRACRPGERDKRRRNQTLSRLCRELDDLSVSHMTLESRGPADDRRDLDALQGFRASKLIGPTLRIAHVGGPVEPMLWVPDAVCGAVVAHRTGTRRYFDAIAPKIKFIDI